MNFVCQQCKELIQLDTSLVDLAPSAYDMIVTSLPPSPTLRDPPKTDAEKLDQLPGPTSSKLAWKQSKVSDESKLEPTTPSIYRVGQTSKALPAPNESFVILQDSVVSNIPSSPKQTPQSRKVLGKSKASPKPIIQTTSQNEPEHPNPAPLSHHLRSTVRLFNLLSTRSDIDHPLCSECTQILLGSLQRQLDETKKERDGYIAFEKEVRKEKEREIQGMSKEEAERKIEKLKSDERITIEQLKAAEREREQLDEEMKALLLEEKQLEEEEEEFWRAHNNHLLQAAQQASQLASLRAAYASDSATLEKLERANVYNDAFCIGHDGVFGTINGLRLGRVPGAQVEWAEINAAWGQTLLLLYTIARKLDYTFDNYRLVPMGSFSRIERTTGDKATYELYGSGDLHLGRLLHNRRFDFAMVAFLDCLKLLMDFVKSQDSHVEFPHPIIKDKIGDASVKLQFNQEEAWTRSLRHVLLGLKILLKWTTNGSNG